MFVYAKLLFDVTSGFFVGECMRCSVFVQADIVRVTYRVIVN